MNVKEVYERLYGIKGSIERAISEYSASGRPMIIDPHELELEDPADPDELGRRDMLYTIIDRLDKVLYDLEYLEGEPLEGVLVKQASGRYDLSGHELTSGETIEILMAPYEGDPPRWIRTRVEHDGEDYYLDVGRQRLGGLMARIR